MLLGLLLLASLQVPSSVEASTVKCFPPAEPNKFEVKCDDLGGVIDGGRCFYGLVDRMGTWDEAWPMCRSDGGVLVQLHTVSEYRKVADYIKTAFAHCADPNGCPLAAFATAYKDLSGISSVAACPNEITARWYYNQTTPIANLNRAQTFAKYSDCSDTRQRQTGPRCFSLAWIDDDCDIGWWGPRAGWYPVCQITNLNQEFSRSSYCMTEPEVETVSGQTADDCAYECAQSAYCRSFNYDSLGNRCELFARSILDCEADAMKCPMRGPETTTCVHYNYIP